MQITLVPELAELSRRDLGWCQGKSEGPGREQPLHQMHITGYTADTTPYVPKLHFPFLLTIQTRSGFHDDQQWGGDKETELCLMGCGRCIVCTSFTAVAPLKKSKFCMLFFSFLSDACRIFRRGLWGCRGCWNQYLGRTWGTPWQCENRSSPIPTFIWLRHEQEINFPCVKTLRFQDYQ